MTNPSILRYPGGKTRAVKTLLPILKGSEVLISPFFGGGSLEFAFANAGGTVHGCDFFKPVANFWQQVKENPQSVACEVAKYLPLAKEDFYMLQQRHMATTDPVEMAAQFYVLNRSSFSGSTLSGGMSPEHRRFTVSSIKRLDDFVMPRVEVTNADMFDWLPTVLRKYARRKDTTIVYLDPPYWIEGDSLYGDKGSTHKGFDHVALAKMLKALDKRGIKWLLSYNNSDEVKNMYAGYKQTEPQWSYGMSKDKSAKELLVYSRAMEASL